MKFILIVLLLCAIRNIAGRRKCGVIAHKCITLSNGNVFWPSDWSAECSSKAICSSGYRLERQIIGELNACCCVLKRMEACPMCDMSKVKKQTFFQWADMHLKENGPVDGTCPSGTYKRIFFGHENLLDKCCCEPTNSPYI